MIVREISRRENGTNVFQYLVCFILNGSLDHFASGRYNGYLATDKKHFAALNGLAIRADWRRCIIGKVSFFHIDKVE